MFVINSDFFKSIIHMNTRILNLKKIWWTYSVFICWILVYHKWKGTTKALWKISCFEFLSNLDAFRHTWVRNNQFYVAQWSEILKRFLHCDVLIFFTEQQYISGVQISFLFLQPLTIFQAAHGYRCKEPFRFCLWSSCSHVEKQRLTSLGLSSCGTQNPCFCTIPMALRRFKIACWVTPKVSASFSWVWHESWSNTASNSVSSNFTSLSSRSLSLVLLYHFSSS